ncbi:hypothetical protein [Oceanobacillus sp. FSL W7-1293]|uniref:hypothetical protein n=1 Tax=Oceanobacillus sp. FSL W7-1293 TaxID=2921699 RepID=UPI0030CB5BB0
MKIIWGKQEININNNEKAEDIVKKIDELVMDEIITHVIFDEEEVYSDIEEYFDSYRQDIEVVKVITKSKKAFINETLLTAEEYLSNAIPIIEKLSESFYQNPQTGDWNQFQRLTEGLTWISNMLLHIDSLKERPSNWEDYANLYKDFEAGVNELAESVEANDTTLIADIIQYEIHPVYKGLKELITNTIDTEGCRSNVN